MAREDKCECGMFVLIRWGHRPTDALAVPLSQLDVGHGADEATSEAVADWRYSDRSSLTPDAVAYLDSSARWFRTEGGYIAEQSTRPNTLAVALGDSPAGLAAWIVEKLQSWSDESAFTMDELLTWVTAYWATGTIGTSFGPYTEPAALPERVETPTILSVFAHDIKPEPRSYAEAFLNIRGYVQHRAGGHFAAWEQPGAYADDVRRAVKIGG